MNVQSRMPRQSRCHVLLVLVHCFSCGGLPELSRDPFVVRLALNEASSKVVDSMPGDEAGDDEDVPGQLAVNMSMKGYPFRCQLPAAAARTRQRQKLNLRHLAAARAAALLKLCFHDTVAVTGELLELCVSDHISIDGISATHQADSDHLLEEGGFEQFYAGVAAGGRSLRVRLRCECQLPPAVPSDEPPCRPGDAVEAPRHLAGGLATPAVVGRLVDDRMIVSWQRPPWPGVPWVNDTRQMEMEREVARSDVVSTDGPRCNQPEPQYPVFSRMVEALEITGRGAFPINMQEAVALDIATRRDFNITLAAVNCCGVRALREKPLEHEGSTHDLEYKRLMVPLIGRCMRLLVTWWTYEICWPWRVRQLHYSLTGEVEDTGTVLGHFNNSQGLVRRRAVPRQEGQSAFEVVTSLEGDPCEQTVHRWDITNGDVSVTGVGGSFNPTRLLAAEGRLTFEQDNQDGCNSYGDINLDGAVVLAKRGGCWFHTKSLNAQAAGAVAVIVFNAQHHMVDLMEGVDELSSPGIPTVLVEDEPGEALLQAIGTHVQLKKSSFDGMELSRTLSTTVTFRCSSLWQHRHEICMQGDEVAVKLPPKNLSSVGSRWPRSSVQVLRATVAEIFRDNGTLAVTWAPSEEPDLDDDLGELPDAVPLSQAYHEGVPCDSKGGARIEEVAELQACSAEFVVHVPELCAHPRLAPPRPRDTQVITCIAEEAAREALANRPRHEPEEESVEVHESNHKEAEDVKEDAALTPEEMKALLARLDINEDGTASLPEIMTFAHGMRIRTLEELPAEEGNPFSDHLDTNGDGLLSLEEHLAATDDDSMGQAKAEVFRELETSKFRVADVNGDGVLDVHESKAYYYPELVDEMLTLSAAIALKGMDVDDNNELSEKEFFQVEDGQDGPIIPEDRTDFDLLDRDDNDVLTTEELKPWESGILYVEKVMIGLVRLVDQDNDDMLSADEVASAHIAIVSSDAHSQLKEWSRSIEL